MSGYTSLVDAAPAFVPGTFDGQDVRLATLQNMLPGLFEQGDFLVSQRAAGANMSLDIGAGRAIVTPQAIARQGSYAPWMGSSYNTSSNGAYVWTAADATNPRIDLLCIEVADTDFGGSFTGWKFRVIDGTPNAGATHQLATTYWPAIPTGCLPLAAIRVPATATTLTDANITNLNPIAGGRPAYSRQTSVETTTSTTYVRLATPSFCFLYVPHAAASIQLFSEGLWKSGGTRGVTLFLNDVQLKFRNLSNGAPVAGECTVASSALLDRYTTSPCTAGSLSNNMFFEAGGGATADVSDITTGVAGFQHATITTGTLDITQLAAGWYVLEKRFKTASGTLTATNRLMRANVVG